MAGPTAGCLARRFRGPAPVGPGWVCGPVSSAPPAPVSVESASAWERVVYGIAVVDENGDPLDHPFLGGFNLPRPQLADADGDGDLDLFVQEQSDRVMYFRNDGAGPESEYRWVTDTYEDLSVGEWLRFVDVDLDGDLDLLTEEPFSYIRYYRNDGGTGPASYVLATDTLLDVDGEPIFSDRQNIPNAADIDCDGFLDLLIGRLTGTITRYEAESTDDDGVPRFRHVTDSFEDIEIVAAMQGSLHGANTMALGDVDQDGDHDLFWGDFFEAGLLFIENTGTCRRPVLREPPGPSRFATRSAPPGTTRRRSAMWTSMATWTSPWASLAEPSTPTSPPSRICTSSNRAERGASRWSHPGSSAPWTRAASPFPPSRT